MNQFIELHQLRNDSELNVDILVDRPVEQLKTIPSLLIGYLYNAFKHGQMNDVTSLLVISTSAVG